MSVEAGSDSLLRPAHAQASCASWIVDPSRLLPAKHPSTLRTTTHKGGKCDYGHIKYGGERLSVMNITFLPIPAGFGKPQSVAC
jgi:hypothetical protein